MEVNLFLAFCFSFLPTNPLFPRFVLHKNSHSHEEIIWSTITHNMTHLFPSKNAVFHSLPDDWDNWGVSGSTTTTTMDMGLLCCRNPGDFSKKSQKWSYGPKILGDMDTFGDSDFLPKSRTSLFFPKGQI